MSSVTSKIRSKTKKASKKAEKLKLTAVNIEFLDLREGDRIVTTFRDDVDEYGNRYVGNSLVVKKITECPGQWRTHVHVNDSDCYDTRGRIWVVNG